MTNPPEPFFTTECVRCGVTSIGQLDRCPHCGNQSQSLHKPLIWHEFDQDDNEVGEPIPLLPPHVRAVLEHDLGDLSKAPINPSIGYRLRRAVARPVERFVASLYPWEYWLLIILLVILALAACLVVGQGIANAEDAQPIGVSVAMSRYSDGSTIDPTAYTRIDYREIIRVRWAVESGIGSLDHWSCNVPDAWQPISILITDPEPVAADFWQWIFQPSRGVEMLFRPYSYTYRGDNPGQSITCAAVAHDGSRVERSATFRFMLDTHVYVPMFADSGSDQNVPAYP